MSAMLFICVDPNISLTSYTERGHFCKERRVSEVTSIVARSNYWLEQ